MAIACSASAVTPCPPEGTAKTRLEKIGNPLKNRELSYTTIDKSVTLEAMLRPGSDAKRFKSEGVEVTGYVAEVKRGGIESCNCGAKDLAHRDWHIALVSDPKDFGNARRYVIVEVTPHTAARVGFTYQQVAAMLHQRIAVMGLLFFDAIHAPSAENTHPGAKANWRATAWEVHPVFKIRKTTQLTMKRRMRK